MTIVHKVNIFTETLRNTLIFSSSSYILPFLNLITVSTLPLARTIDVYKAATRKNSGGGKGVSNILLPKSHAQKNAPIHARTIFKNLLCTTAPLLNFLNYILKFETNQYTFCLLEIIIKTKNGLESFKNIIESYCSTTSR